MPTKSTVKLETLGIEELKNGCYLTIENAEQMLVEADILFNAGHFARAYTLCQLSIEEVRNSYLITELMLDLKVGKAVDYKGVNREFISHEAKSSQAFEKVALLKLFSDSSYGSAKERQSLLTSELNKLEVEANTLNDTKNNSLYVTLKGGRFVSPKDDITKEMAIEIKTNAITRLTAAKGLLKTFLLNLDQLPERIEKFEKEGKRLDVEVLKGFFKD